MKKKKLSIDLFESFINQEITSNSTIHMILYQTNTNLSYPVTFIQFGQKLLYLDNMKSEEQKAVGQKHQSCEWMDENWICQTFTNPNHVR